MYVAIITLPLTNNYGGILQNFALQSVLRQLGHDPITIDYVVPGPSKMKIFLSWCKTIVYRCIGRKRTFLKMDRPVRKKIFSDFVDSYIVKTPLLSKIDQCKKMNFSTFLIGSDQVWRPLYNYKIEEMFLSFCSNENNIKRIAYAASFGVEKWEFSPVQTKKCAKLIKKFNAISVREESGVDLCKINFGVLATTVLDPTLLLRKEEYLNLCKNIPMKKKPVLVAYVLNLDDAIKDYCCFEAKKRGLDLNFFSADSNAKLSIPEWLAMFRDASFVVTDSFHGTIFSILFNKDFKCFNNKERGSARFESLLNMHSSGKLDEMREYSIKWLSHALES